MLSSTSSVPSYSNYLSAPCRIILPPPTSLAIPLPSNVVCQPFVAEKKISIKIHMPVLSASSSLHVSTPRRGRWRKCLFNIPSTLCIVDTGWKRRSDQATTMTFHAPSSTQGLSCEQFLLAFFPVTLKKGLLNVFPAWLSEFYKSSGSLFCLWMHGVWPYRGIESKYR